MISVTRFTEATISWNVWPDWFTSDAPVLTFCTESWINALISLAAAAYRCARFRTSAATTANPRRGAGPRVRRRRRGGSESGAAVGRGRQRDQGVDPRFGAEGEDRRVAREPVRPDLQGDRRLGEARDRDHRRDRRRQYGAVAGDRAGQQGDRPDGPTGAVERRADRGALLHGARPGRPRQAAPRAGVAVQAGRRRPGTAAGRDGTRRDARAGAVGRGAGFRDAHADAPDAAPARVVRQRLHGAGRRRRLRGVLSVEGLGALSSQIGAAAGAQYLTFRLGDEEYGLDILKVQEIRSYAAITPLPNAPPAVKGVMNLRGQIIPVVDLRVTFGMRPTEYTRFAVVIVASIVRKIVGLLADGVSDVLTMARTDVQPAPDFGAPVEARLISGMAKTGEKLVILLDVERLLDGADHDA